MGMTLVGRRLPEEHWQRLLADPGSAWQTLHGPADPQLDVDKAWHGIHYLLTWTAWDISEGAGSAVLGGTPIGDDGGYGPPRVLTPDQVATVAAALEALDVPVLRARYDPDALSAADIYPQVWEGERFDDYLGPHYAELRHFYLAAAAEKQAVLLAIT